MPVQPQSPPESHGPSALPLQSELSYAPAPPPPEPGYPMPIWLQRMSLFVLVIFCVYLGVILAVIPWWPPSMWDYNAYFLSHPRLWAVMRLGAVRGIITGLGLLDIWIGISEAIHYRDQRP